VITVASRTEGFSGREIAKLMVSAQCHVYGLATPALSRAAFEEVLRWKIAEHKAKSDFGSAAYDFVAQAHRGGGGGVGGPLRASAAAAAAATTAAAAAARGACACGGGSAAAHSCPACASLSKPELR